MYFGMLLTSRDGRVAGLTEMSTPDDAQPVPTRLDDRLHRVGVLAVDLRADRRVAAERPEARRRVAHLGAGERPHDTAARAAGGAS